MKTCPGPNSIQYLLGLGLLALAIHASQAQTQKYKLTAEDYAADDHLGSAVSISGHFGLVTAPGADDDGDASGSAYIFDVNSGVQLRKLRPQDAVVQGQFGQAAAIDGDRAIITSGFASGVAYVFDVTTGQQLWKLGPADGGAGEKSFGTSVALADSIAVVGARTDGVHGPGSGAAYVFDVTTGQQTYKLSPNDGAPGDLFGVSVALSGHLVIVGAMGKDNGAGAAYVFDAATGQQLYKLVAADRAPARIFGGAVAIHGTTAVVGSSLDDQRGSRSGSAYVFDVTTGHQLFKLTAEDAAPVDFFGQAVALSGNIALIAAPVSDDETGSAYLFDVTSGQQLAKLLAGDGAAGDSFGGNVAISGGTALIGAGGDSLGADPDTVFAAGSAYVFQMDPPVILSPPAGLTENVGANVLFSVEARGTGPTGVQWMHEGTLIRGATNNALLLTGIQESDQGSYAVVVSDVFGSVTSAPAILIVNQPPLADASATGLFWTSPDGRDASVILDGSRSSDPDGDVLTHVWQMGSTRIASGRVQVVAFGVGKHSVDLVVDDGLAQDTDRILITVLTPAGSVERLESLVLGSGLSEEQQLLSSLNAALASMERGNLIPAANQLHAFLNKLRAQVGPADPELAAELAQVAAQVIDALGGESELRGAGKIRSLQRRGDGHIRLQIEAATGSVYLVEASTNLTDWEAVGTTTLVPDGTIQFEHAERPDQACRFYRTVSP